MISGIEIFSGAGGLATGLMLAGFSHKAFVECNPNACNTLRLNYKTNIIHEGDIRDFEFSKFSGIDFVAGGPPCQPFSLGGKAKGFDDSRDMFPQAIRSIRELSPRAFVFENVKGLLRPSFKDYLDYIILQLTYPHITTDGMMWQEHYATLLNIKHRQTERPRYNVFLNLVNAADYGIPQKRERIIIVGIRTDFEGVWSMPEPTHCHDSLLWDKYVSCEYWDKHSISPSNDEYKTFQSQRQALKKKYGMFQPSLSPWRTIRDALTDIPQIGDLSFFPNEHIERKGAKEYAGHTGSLIDEPAKTIKAGDHGVPGGENMIKFPNGDSRYLTVFEAKRIQTFPDDYAIFGSWTESMRQIGNAVPVELAKIIGKSLIKSVFHDKK